MDLKLTDQVVVVIGGASGIGRAIAAEFAAERARVVVVDRQAAIAETAQELASAAGVPVLGLRGDATDAAGMKQLADRIASDVGPVEHLVYAAGVGSGKYGFPFWNLEPVDWPRVLEVNLTGAFIVSHAFRSHFTERRSGTLLFISSVAGQIGSQTDPPYSAAKAGLINFSQCAAKDLAPYQVRVNTICPGMIQTAVNRSVWQAWYDRQPPENRCSYEAWAGDKVKRVSPLGRWQTCEDIAAVAVFLASSRAQNITGQTLNVDGGQVMHS